MAAGHRVEPARWQAETDRLLDRMAGRFPRVETRRRGRRFILGLLADLPRKTVACAVIRSTYAVLSRSVLTHRRPFTAAHPARCVRLIGRREVFYNLAVGRRGCHPLATTLGA
jgi:hypothetical protein